MSLPSLLSLVTPPPVPPATLGPIAAADRAVLARVLAASHVARVPAPPASSYCGELATAFTEAIVAALMRGARMFHLSRTAFLVLATLVVLAMLALGVRALLPAIRRAGRARRARPEGTPVTHPAPAPERDAAAWRAELEARLAAGETAAALLALWWWLARSLAGSRAEADWTSRELVAQARRPDLLPLARRLDALTYGPGHPSPDDVRALVGRLEAALG